MFELEEDDILDYLCPVAAIIDDESVLIKDMCDRSYVVAPAPVGSGSAVVHCGGECCAQKYNNNNYSPYTSKPLEALPHSCVETDSSDTQSEQHDIDVESTSQFSDTSVAGVTAESIRNCEHSFSGSRAGSVGQLAESGSEHDSEKAELDFERVLVLILRTSWGTVCRRLKKRCAAQRCNVA